MQEPPQQQQQHTVSILESTAATALHNVTRTMLQRKMRDRKATDQTAGLEKKLQDRTKSRRRDDEGFSPGPVVYPSPAV